MPKIILPILFLSVSIASAKDLTLSRYLVRDATVVAKVAEKYEVRRRRKNGFEVIVPRSEAKQFLKIAPQANLLEADISQKLKRLIRNYPSWLSGYYDYPKVVAKLKDIEKNYPHIAKIEIYGQSREGRNLYALKLSDNVGIDEPEPEVMITSATHGNELISVEVVMGLLEKLVNGYGFDKRLSDMVTGRELYFLPVINPDGYVRQSRYTANGTDPNRNFPWPDNPSRTPEPCITSLISFFHAHDIKGSMDYHSSGRMVMYPWAYTYNSLNSVDEQKFDVLTSDMASTNGYVYGQISKVIYVAKGSSADYFYWKNGTISLGIEIGYTNVPHSSQIYKDVEANTVSTWRFIESF